MVARNSKDPGAFPLTQWSVVYAIQSESAAEAARAMDYLCRCYWYPIYAFLRRNGCPAHDAEDLTQAFFHRLITEEALLSARQEAGKLRSYLLAVLKRLISDQQRHQSARKRGGGFLKVSFDEMAAEQRYACEPQDTHDPEWLYTRAWALDLLARVRTKLRLNLEASGRAGIYDLLQPFLEWETDQPSHYEIACKAGISETATRILIHRLRAKFRDLLREEVAKTVLRPEEVADEMSWLKKVLAEK